MMSQHPKHNFRGPIKLKLKRKGDKEFGHELLEIFNDQVGMPIIHFIFWCKIRSRINKYKYAKGRTTIIAQQSKPISCSRAGSLHKPSGVFLTVFPNFLTSGDCMSSIRIYGLQSCKNIEISNIAENWKMIKYIYFTMCYFFPRKK